MATKTKHPSQGRSYSRAIILAAGAGRRLGSAIAGKPKCLIDLGGRTLLQRQVEAFREVGVEEFVVVVGYKHEAIRAHFSSLSLSNGLTFVENPLFDRTNTLYSLWLAREYCRSGFFYANADVLFDSRLLRRLTAGKEELSKLACVKGPCGPEEVKIIAMNGRIVRIGKEIDPARSYGEFLGVAWFSPQCSKALVETLDIYIRDRQMWQMFFEHALDHIVESQELYCIDVTDIPALEIDFPQDLERARTTVLPRLANLYPNPTK